MAAAVRDFPETTAAIGDATNESAIAPAGDKEEHMAKAAFFGSVLAATFAPFLLIFGFAPSSSYIPGWGFLIGVTGPGHVQSVYGFVRSAGAGISENGGAFQPRVHATL